LQVILLYLQIDFFNFLYPVSSNFRNFRANAETSCKIERNPNGLDHSRRRAKQFGGWGGTKNLLECSKQNISKCRVCSPRKGSSL